MESIAYIFEEARAYIGTYHSIQQTEGDPYLLIDIKSNNAKYVEAIVLMHLNPSLPHPILSKVVGLKLSQAQLDIIAGFYVRAEMNDGKRSGNTILSPRQLRRRQNRECFQLTDIDYGAE